MNSAQNGFAPFNIKIDYTTFKKNSMDFNTIPCNESTPGGDGKYFILKLKTET